MCNCRIEMKNWGPIGGLGRVPLDVVRLGTLRTEAGWRAVVLRDGQLAELPGSVRELLGAGPDALQRSMEAAGAVHPYDPARLAPALADPGKVTLEPGDVIATGTPGGVGFGRRPPVWLRPGQTVISRIEGLGDLKNQVVEEPPPSP
jgi:Fumarylacetoacetate (FAA) hydrolase family